MAVVSISVFSKPAFAAAAESSMTAAGLRMFWGLLLVLGILLLIYGFARKRLSPVYANDKSKIKVLEIRHLMPKKSLCLVEVSGREYLLGLGSDNITLLSGSKTTGDTKHSDKGDETHAL